MLGSEGKPVTYQRQRVLDVCPFLKLIGFLETMFHNISSLPARLRPDSEPSAVRALTKW